MKQTTNKMVIALDINEIMHNLQCMADEAIELGEVIDDDYIYEALCKLTLDAGLWEETDNDWYEVYQDSVDSWNAHGHFFYLFLL
jgi:hypothetical protein